MVWPGQHAGFLGEQFDPFQVNSDPNQDEFHISGLQLPTGLSVERLKNRHGLLQQLRSNQKGLDQWAGKQNFNQYQESAYAMLTSPHFSRAFQIQKEPDSVRDRYGRNTMGQTLLLARRLVEREIPVVQCNMGTVQTWDNHSKIFPALKDHLLPQLDQTAGTLLDELHETGLLEQTLVIVAGEFGRTPRITQLDGKGLPGRDHWAWAYTGHSSPALAFKQVR